MSEPYPSPRRPAFVELGIVTWILLALGVLGMAGAVLLGGAGAALLAVLAIACLLMGAITAATE